MRGIPMSDNNPEAELSTAPPTLCYLHTRHISPPSPLHPEGPIEIDWFQPKIHPGSCKSSRHSVLLSCQDLPVPFDGLAGASGQA